MLKLLTFGVPKAFPRIMAAAQSSSSPSGSKVAIVLSGSGVFDGTEVHEASAILVHLTRAGAEPVCYAPDIPQMHVVDHSKGSPVEGESRNVLAESARIARGVIKPLAELKASSVDAVIFPGGFGAAKNLSDWAVKGKDCTVLPDVERVLKDFHASKKPIGLCCISPVLAAKVLPGTTLTLGQIDNKSGKWPYAETIEGASSLGAIVVPKNVNEVSVCKKNLVVTTPAFMYDGKFFEIFDGIGLMVKEVLNLIKK
uniref:Uncharacterized protein n=1 Tax=Timema genevievae TaxID=629358 RepID=A0A7R9JNQ8_TIMGE|nr:unnamed protein product [Timema genevievae]